MVEATTVLRALDQEVLTSNLSQLHLSYSTHFRRLHMEVMLCFKHSTRGMGGEVPQSARLSTNLVWAWATTKVFRMCMFVNKLQYIP